MRQYLLTEDELRGLLTRSVTLEILETAGVDEWEGWDEAFETFLDEFTDWVYENNENYERIPMRLEDVVQNEMFHYLVYKEE